MALQILLNSLLAFVWMFLSSNFTLNAFIIGYLLGLLFLFAVRKLLPGRFYISRVWALVKLSVLFLKELILANIAVLKVVLQPKLNLAPAFFKYETTLTKDWEITLLSSLITLTPGTVVVHLSDDSKTLFIHAIDVEDVEDTITSIRDSFEKAILEVSRA
jgi:multicomponent Na+:H+ antiporter subunit E